MFEFITVLMKYKSLGIVIRREGFLYVAYYKDNPKKQRYHTFYKNVISDMAHVELMLKNA